MHYDVRWNVEPSLQAYRIDVEHWSRFGHFPVRHGVYSEWQALACSLAAPKEPPLPVLHAEIGPCRCLSSGALCMLQRR